MFNIQTNSCTQNMKLSVENKCHSFKECVAIDSVSPFMKWTELKCNGEDQVFDQQRQECVHSANST